MGGAGRAVSVTTQVATDLPGHLALYFCSCYTVRKSVEGGRHQHSPEVQQLLICILKSVNIIISGLEQEETMNPQGEENPPLLL